jgi:hypothetical protein
MRLRTFVQLGLFALGGAIATSGAAQTTAGAGTVIVLPLAASIPAAYTTTVFVRNLDVLNPLTVNVRYYLADDATPSPPPGTNTPYCPSGLSQITVPANSVFPLDPKTQCTFPDSDIFGMIVLEDAASPKTNAFVAYSRTEQPAGANGPGNGFSVEGFPIGNFSSAQADALGLRRSVAAPHYKSNCFIGAGNEPVNYLLRLWTGTGAPIQPIGNPLSGTVQPWHIVRVLDVFTAAGAAATDYANVRATFTNSGGSSAMFAFCTLETSDNGSADFRVAKSSDARDVRQARVACYGQDDCGSTSLNNAAQITDSSTKNIHYMIIDQPDYVQCSLVSPNVGGLEIMLRGPGPIQGNTPFPVGPGFSSGGVGAQSFYVYTGDKGAINNGSTTRWYVDVSYKQGSGFSLPISYGITCRSGNGVSVPWIGATGAANP